MQWELDSVHTQIGFAIQHMMVTLVKGRFTRFDGVFEINEENPSLSHFEVTIDASSVSTGDAERDAHIRSADFFDVDRFPTITYASGRIDSLGFNKYHIYGDLTIHGVTHPVMLEVTVTGPAQDPNGQRRSGGSIRAKVSRTAFGLEWNTPLENGGNLLGDTVQIEIDAEFVATVTVRT